MPASTDKAPWERLGQMLTRRRVELDPRYARSLQAFASERNINHRLAWDIEGAKRTNYTRASLALVEVAYGLEHGSIGDALAGGSFRLSGHRDRETRQGARDGSASGPGYQAIRDADGLTGAEKELAIEAVRSLREKMTRAGFTEEEQWVLEQAPAAFAELVRRERARRMGGPEDGEVSGQSA